MDIELNLELMLFVFVLFVSSIYILNKWLYEPILNFMDSREDMIKNDLENANSNDSNIESIYNEINSILENAKKEATILKETAFSQAKAVYEKNIDELKVANEKNLADFLVSLKAEKQQIKQSLLSHIPEFQVALSKKLKQNVEKSK